MVSLIKEFHTETAISSLRTSLILFPLAGSCWLTGRYTSCLSSFLATKVGLFCSTGNVLLHWVKLVPLDWISSVWLVWFYWTGSALLGWFGSWFIYRAGPVPPVVGVLGRFGSSGLVYLHWACPLPPGCFGSSGWFLSDGLVLFLLAALVPLGWFGWLLCAPMLAIEIGGWRQKLLWHQHFR